MTNKNIRTGAPESEEWFCLSLREVSWSFGVESHAIIEIINEGIISVKQTGNNEWQFDSNALRRIRTVLRLQHDLGVNLAGACLALDLLDEIHRLKSLHHFNT